MYTRIRKYQSFLIRNTNLTNNVYKDKIIINSANYKICTRSHKQIYTRTTKLF